MTAQRGAETGTNPVGYALLAFLDGSARHGYELKQRWDATLGSSRSLQFGQIYATLARLERDGLIELDTTEAGHGPERKCYAITEAGRAALDVWLKSPVPPDPHLGTPLFAKLVLGLQAGRDVGALLDAQRATHLAQMRELTRMKSGADRATALLADHALFHLEADLRFLDHAAAHVVQLAQEVGV